MKDFAMSCLLGGMVGFANVYAPCAIAKDIPVASSKTGVAEFEWLQMHWKIPKEFLLDTRFLGDDDKQLWIVVGYVKSDARLMSASGTEHYDLQINVHIRRVNTEDPRNGLALIRRVGLPFARLPLFSTAHFNGMTYVGSDVQGPFFYMSKEDVYVNCYEEVHDKLLFPQVSPTALSEKYHCGTTFALPSGLYAWVQVDYVHLNDVAKAFVTMHNMIYSLIQ